MVDEEIRLKVKNRVKIHIFQQENLKLKHLVITIGKGEAESEI